MSAKLALGAGIAFVTIIATLGAYAAGGPMMMGPTHTTGQP